MRPDLKESVDMLTARIACILGGSVHSIWLYGSVVLDDFRFGWSDIDFIALSSSKITEEQARLLLDLRARLFSEHPDIPYFNCFEGVIASFEEFVSRSLSRLVYWGTTGQRITDRCDTDAFAMYQLAKYGVSVCGSSDRSIFELPSREKLIEAVRRHLNAIRLYAKQTDESLYSCGWMLDIARCVYTVRHNDVISKTAAGEWALKERLFADEAPLIKTLSIRREPQKYVNDQEIMRWLASLGPTVQSYADVLEAELERDFENNASQYSKY